MIFYDLQGGEGKGAGAQRSGGAGARAAERVLLGWVSQAASLLDEKSRSGAALESAN